jgi:spermidine synthase
MLSMLGHLWGGPVVFRDGGIEVRERNGVRTLHLGSDTIQSAMQVADPDALELAYTRAMMAFLLFVTPPGRTLMVGLGGGSLAKFMYRRVPQTHVRVVEVDPAVVHVAREYFALPADDSRLAVVVDDGADYVRRASEPIDALLIDAYDGRSLAQSFTVDAFYARARAALSAEGVLVMNLWSSDRAFDRNLQRIERAFSHRCLCLPAERPGNVIVFAFVAKPRRLRWLELREHAALLEERFGLDFPRFVRDLQKMNRYDATGLHMEDQAEDTR